MENQHRHIKGYRELSQQEIDLMNKIKDLGTQMLILKSQLDAILSEKEVELKTLAASENDPQGAHAFEYRRFTDAEPKRWASIGKTHIQEGVMALVRAVAQPSGI